MYHFKWYREIKRFFRQLVHAIQWGIFMFNDKNYDGSNILRILYKKIKNTRQYIEKHGLVEECLPSMREAEIYLDRLINYDYEESFDKQHKKRWGESQISFEGAIIKINYPKVTTPEEQELCRKELIEGRWSAVMQRQDDLNSLCNCISGNLYSWWD